ncbi:ABC transporter ATP-binding protein [bacterium]|nr:ABC transporter ATP-binding protein [bacterium]
MPDIELEEEVLGKAYDPKLARRIFKLALPHKREIFITVIFMLIASSADLARPYILRLAIDKALLFKDFHRLIMYGVFYMLCIGMSSLFSGLQSYFMTRMGETIVLNLRNELFAHLQNLDLSYHNREKVGRMISRLTSDIDAILELISSGITTIIGDGFVLIGIIILLLSMNLTLTGLTFLLLPLLFLLSFEFRKRMRDIYRMVRISISIVTGNFAESMAGIKVTKVFARFKESAENFYRLTQNSLEAVMRSVRLAGIYFPTVELISACGTALILWYGGTKVIQGAITIGTLVAFLNYLGRFFGPIQELTNIYNVLQSAMAGAERVFGILDIEPKIKDAPNAIDVDFVEGRIDFEHVYFGYEPERMILEDFNLHIEPSEKIGIAGPTGAGKTSITNLLLRFYQPQGGRILIDGIDLQKISNRSLRRLIAIVPQEPFIFSGTILENIRFGRLDATVEEVERACELACLGNLLSRLPKGLYTELGERGAGISVGEKQLISIARAILSDPRILILDEATSNIDTETEKLIQIALQRLMEGRTSIVIAHRLSTIKKMDRIIVIQDGKIAEMGTHEELLRNGGLYSHLVEISERG